MYRTGTFALHIILYRKIHDRVGLSPSKPLGNWLVALCSELVQHFGCQRALLVPSKWKEWEHALDTRDNGSLKLNLVSSGSVIPDCSTTYAQFVREAGPHAVHEAFVLLPCRDGFAVFSLREIEHELLARI